MSKYDTREIAIAVRILGDALWELGTYIFQNTDNPQLKLKLIELGKQIKAIRLLRR